MYFRPAILALFTVFIFTAGTGCQKSETSAPVAALPTPLSPDAVVRVHWLGKNQIDLDAGAYYFSRIWSLPETARLRAQTFDKLATNSWRLLLGDAAGAQIPAAVLRPLFDDLVQNEFYLEVRAATNSQPSQACFAARVSAKHAGTWETNLAIAAELSAGGPVAGDPASHGWTLQQTNASGCITLRRVGEWTVVGTGPEKNPLLDEISARILRDRVPFVSSETNLWLEANFDLPRLAACVPTFNFQLSTFNRLNLTVTGDGYNVIADGRLTFAGALPLRLEPWHVPLDLIHEPLIGFTAVRGVQPWLAGWKTWDDLQIGSPPDQLFFWSLTGSAFQTYIAAPLPDARRQVSALTDHLLQKGNPWLATNGYISFDRAPDSNGVVWGNLPDIKPFIKSFAAGADGWLFAGLLPDTGAPAGSPPPAAMVQEILHQTNLVYYDWEETGRQIQPRLLLGQTVRQVSRRPPMPMDSASLNFLAMLMPRLGASTTVVSLAAPDQITFHRRSTIGFTAVELHLLADWLESPEFPRGLHSSR